MDGELACSYKREKCLTSIGAELKGEQEEEVAARLTLSGIDQIT